MSIPTEWLGPVEEAVSNGVLVAWDGCHKMYVVMDEHSARWFRHEYRNTACSTAEDMMNTLHDWWDESCELRFITSVGNIDREGEYYDDLIPQGAESSPF